MKSKKQKNNGRFVKGHSPWNKNHFKLNPICRKCKIKLTQNNWHLSCQKYKNYICKACHKKATRKGFGKYLKSDKNKERKRRYSLTHKKENKNRSLKRDYNITLETYNKMFNKQKGCCAICKKHQSELNRSLNVDHNHKTGEVRKLLCDRCNNGLGCFKDDILLLKMAVKYFEENCQ